MSATTNKILQYDLTGDRAMIFGTYWEGFQTPITMTEQNGTVLDGCDLITSVDLYVRDKPDSLFRNEAIAIKAWYINTCEIICNYETTVNEQNAVEPIEFIDNLPKYE